MRRFFWGSLYRIEHAYHIAVRPVFFMVVIVAIGIVMSVYSTAVSLLVTPLDRGPWDLYNLVPKVSWGWYAIAIAATIFIGTIEKSYRILCDERSKVAGLNERLAPKFDVSFRQDPINIVVVQTLVRVENSPEAVPSEGSYIRVVVETLSAVAVRNVRATLTKLQRKSSASDKFHDINLFNIIDLRSELFTVYSRMPTTVDFLCCGALDNKLKIAAPFLPFDFYKGFDAHGVYRCTIVVADETVSREITVDVEYYGKWNEIKAWRIAEPSGREI